MKNLFVIGLLLVTLLACGGVNSLQDQAKVQACQENYDSCRNQCSSYWLASEKESCLNRCTNDYQICRNYA